MDSDRLGSLLYFMSLCDRITSEQQFGTLMNKLTIKMGKQFISKVLFVGLQTITTNNSKALNIISSMSNIVEDIIEPTTFNNKHSILNLSIDDISLICSFLHFNELLSFEKTNKLICAISRRPSSLTSISNSSKSNHHWLESYGHYISKYSVASIDISRFKHAHKLQMKCSLETFLPLQHNENPSEKQIINGYRNMAIALTHFNPYCTDINSVELELDTNCVRYSGNKQCASIPVFMGEYIHSLSLINMELSHINTLFKYQQEKPFIISNKLAMINCRCDKQQNRLYDPLKLTKNCVVNDIQMFLENMFKSQCNELYLDIDESNLYLFDPQNVINTLFINNVQLIENSFSSLQHFTFIARNPPKHNKLIFISFARSILNQRGTFLKSLTLQNVEYNTFHVLFGQKGTDLQCKTPFQNQEQYEFLTLFDVNEDNLNELQLNQGTTASASISYSHSYLNADKRYSVSPSATSNNDNGDNDDNAVNIFDDEDYRIALQEYNKDIQLSNADVLGIDFQRLQNNNKLFSETLEYIHLSMSGFLYKPLLQCLSHSSKRIKSIRLHLWWTNALQQYRDMNESASNDMLQCIETFLEQQMFETVSLTNIVFDVMMMFKEEDAYGVDGVPRSIGVSNDFRTERMIKRLKKKCERIKVLYQLLTRIINHNNYKQREHSLDIALNINFEHNVLQSGHIFDNKEEVMWDTLIVNNLFYHNTELNLLLDALRARGCNNHIHNGIVIRLTYNLNHHLFKMNTEFHNFINNIKSNNVSKISVFPNYVEDDKTTIQIAL